MGQKPPSPPPPPPTPSRDDAASLARQEEERTRAANASGHGGNVLTGGLGATNFSEVGTKPAELLGGTSQVG